MQGARTAQSTTIAKNSAEIPPRGGISALFLAIVVLCAVLAPWIAPYPYDVQDLSISS
ncbi:MAG: hypothetical protein E6Q98_26780, partial [Rhodospirillaceae bacterium]